MRTFGKLLGRVLLALLVAGFGLWLFGPYEDATLTPTAGAADIGPDLDAHFAAGEGAYDDITPGVEKRVVWAGAPGQETEWSVLYVHGFSATSEEIRPVPDRVAEGLGANLIYTRLRGHGRSGDALAEGSVRAWVDDLAEGLAAARIAGQKTLILSTSTGGTLVAALSQNDTLMQDVAGVVFISPNFGIANPVARLLSWPAARYWLPVLAGQRRAFTPRNEAHATYWTTEYPSVAVMPMAALIDASMEMDHSQSTLPALFWFSNDDSVVRPNLSAQVAAQWGGPVEVVNPIMTTADDPQSHVIAGDIMSPVQTETAVLGILEWAQKLGAN
mmetsp:Transcript_29426/g.57578  ORF Transcript_29426/g.57578 Transcript_29426/m.57578 type:complete len:330 (-) Transcript_29426:1227-2216(-)